MSKNKMLLDHINAITIRFCQGRLKNDLCGKWTGHFKMPSHEMQRKSEGLIRIGED